MDVFQKSILEIALSELNPEACKQIWHLNLSKDLNTILQAIEVDNVTSSVYDIYGEPGSGCSTLMQGLCQLICKRNNATESEVLYLSLCKGFKGAAFLDFVVKLINERYHDESLSLFAKISSNKDLKKKSVAEFLGKHFKLICIDNAELCHNFSDSFLNDILKMCTATSFVGFSQTNFKRPGVNSIIVNGLSESNATALVFNSLRPQIFTENEIANLCCVVNCNPVAIQLVCAVLNSQEENRTLSSLLTDLQYSCSARNFGSQKLCILEMVLDWINKVSDISCTGMLCSLCCLRQPLPMLEMSPKLEKIVQLNLLNVKKVGKAQCIYLPSTINKFLTCRKHFYSKDDKLDLLQQWLSLVSNQKLHSLIREAEEHAWPFVPESWQFIDEKDVGENESSNVKEHIISNNAHVPSLTELQILHECLYHAYLQQNFQKLAAVTFVLDRFLFWQGDKKISMGIVDYIQKNSPETAIAPQLLVRRARVMKNEGNLRGAEEVLNEVTKERTRVGHWKYRHEFQGDLTRAACIQLKGEIQYILGNWVESAGLLLESIELFNNLPNPDKKGLSLGYGLLCPCLRNMNHKDYSNLAKSFGLVQIHPLLAAYISAQEAARSSSYTPMFFVRHICHAGEVLLELIKLSNMEEEKQILLRVAIEDLKDSIQAHQSYKSLTSREQFYILVLALFKLSLALLELHSEIGQDVGRQLKGIAAKLYQHYCSSKGHVLVDEKVVELIDKCMDLLQLEKYQSDDLPDAGQILLRYYKRRTSQRLIENTRLRVEGLFVNSKQILLSPVSPELPSYGESNVMHSPVDLKLLQHRPSEALENFSSERKTHVKTVDRFAGTLEDECTGKNDLERPGTNEIVDRFAVTVELEEKEEQLKENYAPHKDTAGQEVGLTVDRCAETVELEEEEECQKPKYTPDKDTARQEGGMTTGDRCAVTTELEEKAEHLEVKSAVDKDTVRQEVGLIIDRCAETVELEDEGEQLEARSIPEKVTAAQEVTMTADRCEVTVESVNEDAQKPKSIIQSEALTDEDTFPVKEENISKTVNEYAFLISRSVEGDSGIIVQSLEDETISLPTQTEPQVPLHYGVENLESNNDQLKRTQDGILWKYDYPSRKWRCNKVMVFVGGPLELKKGLEGAQRDVFAVEFINQDEPQQRYVAKRYRKKIHHQQYENDVLCQMTARHYVTKFNHDLSIASTGGESIGEIQFLPVVLLQLVNASGHVTDVLNAEPYMSGEFTKLTNNVDWKNEKRRTDLVLAYSHFTYQESQAKLIIVDIQGWAPRDKKGCTFLTDPQIHSPVFKCFGTGNHGEKGFERFWTELHSECNHICSMLKLKRP